MRYQPNPYMMQPHVPVDPIDRLQKLQNLDASQTQSDLLQQHGAMQMAQGLYGIQHEQQMLPEQLKALAASTAARQFETEKGQQELPEQLRGMRAENAGREFQNQWNQPNAMAKNRLENAQAANMEANADATRKYDQPSLHDLMSIWPLMSDTDRYTALGKVPGMADVGAAGLKRISDAQAARNADMAADQARLHPEAPTELHIPPQYQHKPEVEKLVSRYIQDHQQPTPTDPEYQKTLDSLSEQISPVSYYMNQARNWLGNMVNYGTPDSSLINQAAAIGKTKPSYAQQ